MGRRRSLLLAVAVVVVGGGALLGVRLSGGKTQEQQAAPPRQPVALDLSAVEIPEELSEGAAATLKENGFVVTPHGGWQVVSIYRGLQRQHKPIYVTTDAALHVSHLVFDFYLRFLEITSLRQDLANLTDAMLAKSVEYWDTARQPEIKEAALRNAGYFFVAKALLTGAEPTDMPPELKRPIEQELALIDRHQGLAESPMFGAKEDYSQYKPRGHYSRSPEFASYFKAMMWYGRMTFRLGLEGSDVPEEVAKRETRQALLICKALDQTKIKGEAALAVLRRIKETTAYFAGRSDDLTPQDYLEPAKALFGDDLPLARLAAAKRLKRFRERAAKLPRPRILSTLFVTGDRWRDTKLPWPERTMGMRLMGQRFTPDSYVFNQLVFANVKEYTGGDPKPFTWVNAQDVVETRGFPLGLDLLSVFGSEEAAAIIHERGDDRYLKYDEQIAKLRAAYHKLSGGESGLYLGRLAAAREAIAAPPPGAPAYMSRQPWRRKQLLTALGAWTELKHDTILYTKQPYSARQAAFAVGKTAGPAPPPPPPVHGYVEPAPEVFASLEALASDLAKQIKTLGFPSDRALTGNLDRLANLMDSLETIARDELANKTLSDDQQDLIEHIGGRFSTILSFPHYLDVADKFRSEVETTMPIIADVHTDSNTLSVLEEAIGAAMMIYAVGPVDGKATVCRGVVYSQYEFKQPMADRMTDEEWRKMLGERKVPALAEWTQAFIAAE